ncbi:hypothetical protein I316_04436 [Kwoniella heveanensis BCC8398]|uniref:Uncharacterized protein n=1 Tax=Kwoniella heveanensis BCC8398 TaxID=1296120 RepID=A0A1B9GRN6_9TREE|nr:hypothetical protein I316_04436 [Kwoniella heveanensis BCC8398]
MSNCTNITCNHNVGSPNLINGKVLYSSYEYLLNETSTQVFLGFFCAVTCLHILLAVYWRRGWTLLTLGLGGSLEAIGWGGRYWSAKTTFWQPGDGGLWDLNNQAFIMQIVCLIIAPTFFSAANYIFLGSLVRSTGARYSSITASSFSKMFTFADFLCLLIQCIGGGMVGTATTSEGIKTGLHVMAVGVIAQVTVTAIFSALFAEFSYRISKDQPALRQYDLLAWTRIFKIIPKCTRNRRQTADGDTPMVELSNSPSSAPTPCEKVGKHATRPPRKTIVYAQIALLASNLLVLARSIYRCDELLGYTPEHPGSYADQNVFIALDASPMLALLVVYLVVHPGLVDGRRLF